VNVRNHARVVELVSTVYVSPLETGSYANMSLGRRGTCIFFTFSRCISTDLVCRAKPNALLPASLMDHAVPATKRVSDPHPMDFVYTDRYQVISQLLVPIANARIANEKVSCRLDQMVFLY
jgi:hypothetical protein